MGIGEKPMVRVRAVKAGDEVVKMVSVCGFTDGVVPEDGFIIQLEGSQGNFPIYVRGSDLVSAQQARTEAGRPVPVRAQSW